MPFQRSRVVGEQQILARLHQISLPRPAPSVKPCCFIAAWRKLRPEELSRHLLVATVGDLTVEVLELMRINTFPLQPGAQYTHIYQVLCGSRYPTLHG